MTPGLRRDAVAWAIRAKDYSQRRACRLIGMDPKTWRYASRRPDDAAVRGRLRELAAERRRFGYRRLHILLDREGLAMNHKKLFRLYREEGLSVRKRGGRKRALGTRSPMMLPDGPNQRWSLDFVSDALNNGRRFRVLTVVDDYTRECLALVADTSLSGERLGRELDRIGEHRGFPMMIVSDNVLYREASGRFGNTSPSAVCTVVEKYCKQKPGGLHRKIRALPAIANTGSSAACWCRGPNRPEDGMRKPRWKTLTLSTGSQMRPHGTNREGFLHLAPALRRKAGNRHRV